MRRTLIRIANVALFVLCCFLAGGIVSQISADLLLPEAAETPAGAVAPVPLTQRSWADRKVILDRNLFGATVSAADLVDEEPEVVQQDLGTVEDTTLPLRLLGTIAATDSHLSRAAIEDKSTRAHEVLAEGDFLEKHPKVSLHQIQRRAVILDNSGTFEKLSLDEEEAVTIARPTAAPRARVASRDSRKASRNRLAERLKKMRENAQADAPAQDQLLSPNAQAELLSQARILPKYEDGAMVGLELNKITPGSVYERMGLQDGDIITSIGGVLIDDPSKTPVALAGASGDLEQGNSVPWEGVSGGEVISGELTKDLLDQ